MHTYHMSLNNNNNLMVLHVVGVRVASRHGMEPDVSGVMTSKHNAFQRYGTQRCQFI